MSGLQATEQECAANAKAPRVSLTDIQNAIETVDYISAAEAVGRNDPRLWLLTLCFVTMRNGFILIGKSAPASAENFNHILGRKLAYEDAVRQIWPLMDFELRQRLHAAGDVA
jgi:Phage protein (N4 Gp49/phage Sf6 gene 66) family